MSFTTETVGELLDLPIGKTCCRKALLLGLFFGGKTLDDRMVETVFRTDEIGILACELLKKQFSADSSVEQITHAGRIMFTVRARSRSICGFINEIDSRSSKSIREIASFRCDNCKNEFLRGVFLAAGTINDPKKGYHLEFSITGEERAKILSDFLAEEIGAPKLIKRGIKIGVYYKNNGSISDIMYYMGASKNSFEVTNAFVERDIRNRENRATNCVARNISRSVEASQKQISAIEYLESRHKLQNLPEEIQYTARLRVENDSASLTELAMLHNPPITKSGLNQRLTKILRLAEELKERE